MLKNREVPTDLKTFNSHFSSLAMKYEAHTIFDDLLSLIICCMAHGKAEYQYFKIIEKYEKKEIDFFCRMFAELMMIYNEAKKNNDWCDPLGEYYELLASNYKKSNFGQFFTPKAVCDLMVQLTMEPTWGKNINEPCCGSGRLILASNNYAEGNYYICEDLDPICCKMTAINLCFHDIRAEIHCHNVLTRSNKRFTYIVNYEHWKHKTNTIFLVQPS